MRFVLKQVCPAHFFHEDLGGGWLSRNNVVRITDHPGITLAFDYGCKAIKQTVFDYGCKAIKQTVFQQKK